MKNWRRIPALLLALVMSLSLLTPAFAAGLPFADVPADAWYRNDVAAIYQTGIFNGTTSTTFDPDGILTHGQAIAIAARLISMSTRDGSRCKTAPANGTAPM